MVDKKLIKEKLFYLSDNYCIPISIRDNGSVVFYENDFYKDIEDALISWEVILLDNENDTNLDFRKEEQGILDIIEELKNKKRITTDMMNKKELTTLVDAMRFNANILNEKLGEQENLLGELLELQETLAVQLGCLERELEYINIIDKDKKLDEDEEYEDELRVGDYISIPNLKGDYDLFQILETESKQFFKLQVDTPRIAGDKYDSIDELIESLVDEEKERYYDDLYFYYVKDNPKHIKEGRYLIYDAKMDGSFEVVVNYNEDENVYEILCAGGDDYFYEETFDSLDALELKLRRDYGLIRSLRCNRH